MIVTFSKLLFSKELPLSRMVIRIELAVLPVVSHIFVILLVSIALVLFTIAFCPIHIAAAGRRVTSFQRQDYHPLYILSKLPPHSSR